MCLILYGAFSVFLPLSLKPWKIMEGIWSSVHYRFWNLELQPWKQEVCGVTLFYFDMGPLLTWGESFWGETYELDSLPTIPLKADLPSEPSKQMTGFVSKFLAPWAQPQEPNMCRTAPQRFSCHFLSPAVAPMAPGFIFLVMVEIRGEECHPESHQGKKSFSGSFLLATIIYKRSYKIISFFQSLGRRAAGALVADACRHPVACARSPFQLGHPVTLKAQPLLMAHWGHSSWTRPFTGWYQLHIFCILNHIKYWIILKTSIFLFHSFLE